MTCALDRRAPSRSSTSSKTITSTATLALLLASGCYEGKASGPDGPNDATAGDEGSTGSEDPGDPAALCEGNDRISAPQRRLTRFEYNNTVRDLLGTTLTPADDFPIDEVAGGYSNNAGVLTVSALHAEKYMLAAEALATEAVTANLAGLLPCTLPLVEGQREQEDACAQDFIEDFGRLAYRRPLEQADFDRLLRAYEAGRADGGPLREGIEVVLRAILQSPKFLFRLELRHDTDPTDAPGSTERVRLDAYEIATRLSYTLWASTPDRALLDAAEAGELSTSAQIGERAREMLADPRARPAIAEFFRQWLGLTKLDTITRDPNAFPQWNDDLRAGMKAETAAFIEHLLWSGDRKLASLFTLPVGFANASLAAIYGASVPPGTTTPARVDLPAELRSGVLTQPGFLAVHAHPDQTSPVLRGKVVRSKFFCSDPPPPPDNVDLSLPTGEVGKTARERFSQHASDPSCASCHRLMDQIGFAFEQFDAVGAHRTEENGVVIDLSGELVGTDVDGTFAGVRELADLLTSSTQVQECFADQWFRFASGRFSTPGDTCSLTKLRDELEAADGDIVELIVAATQTEAFMYRSALTTEED